MTVTDDRRRKHRYVTVKIYAAGQDQTSREVAALRHINAVLAASSRVRHVGSANVRTLLDQFVVSHPKSSRDNLCLVFKPLGMSLAETRKILFGGRLPLDVVKGIVFYLLRALDFLHRKAKLVHGGTFLLSFSASTPVSLRRCLPKNSKIYKRTISCSPLKTLPTCEQSAVLFAAEL